MVVNLSGGPLLVRRDNDERRALDSTGPEEKQ